MSAVGPDGVAGGKSGQDDKGERAR